MIEVVTAKVSRLWDGDSLRVYLNNELQSIRLAWIDCPETPKSQMDYRHKTPFYRNQYKWGCRAMDRAKELIKNDTKIQLFTWGEKDSYDRHLCFIVLPIPQKQETFINSLLVKEGLAVTDLPWDIEKVPAQMRELYQAIEQAEKYAIENQLGLWGDSDFIPPQEWRLLKEQRYRERKV